MSASLLSRAVMAILKSAIHVAVLVMAVLVTAVLVTAVLVTAVSMAIGMLSSRGLASGHMVGGGIHPASPLAVRIQPPLLEPDTYLTAV